MSDLEDIFDRAEKKADEAVGDQLDEILRQGDQLTKVFDDLKLTDPGTYASLQEIVQDATERNESVAAVIDRVKALGAAGEKLGSTILSIGSVGGLSELAKALGS